ncbi:MAG: peroxide stress protein YaaA [Phascolarctobacterium sp.]|nr:peroxide stress protein YaaA [Phascolarctobacterium sp.]
MKIIISPAKKMRIDNDTFVPLSKPNFLYKTELLMASLKQMELPALQKLWECNDEIAQLNFKRLQRMNLERNLTPAVFAYDGLQYQHLAPNVLDEDALEYLQKNLRILSGFYGILRAFDGVVPYRLEMQARLACDGYKNLYAFWNRLLYDELTKDDGEVLNLASKEYSKAVEGYVTKDVRFVTCVFGTYVKGKLKVKATEAKMARGEMVRLCAENNVQSVDEVKAYNVRGYVFNEELSGENEFVFVKA